MSFSLAIYIAIAYWNLDFQILAYLGIFTHTHFWVEYTWLIWFGFVYLLEILYYCGCNVKQMRRRYLEDESGSQQIANTYDATEPSVCVYFLNGTCNKGSECVYSHSLDARKPVCKFFLSLQVCTILLIIHMYYLFDNKALLMSSAFFFFCLLIGMLLIKNTYQCQKNFFEENIHTS